jgi:hypothetical protein
MLSEEKAQAQVALGHLPRMLSEEKAQARVALGVVARREEKRREKKRKNMKERDTHPITPYSTRPSLDSNDHIDPKVLRR